MEHRDNFTFIINYTIWVLLVHSDSLIWSDHLFLGLPGLLFPCGWYY